MIDILQVIYSAQISAPSYEVMILLLVLTICLLLRATKTGLLAAYLFTYRWVWLMFERSFGPNQMIFLYGFLIFGFVVLILALISMLTQNH